MWLVLAQSRVQMWLGRAQSRVQMWQGRAQSRVQMWLGRAQPVCRCGRGEPSFGADVAGASPVPVQMWQACTPRGEPGARGEDTWLRGDLLPEDSVPMAATRGAALDVARAFGA